MTQTEKNSPWQNKAEVEIRELKRHARRLMQRSGTPLMLWDLCCQYIVELCNRMVRPVPQQKGRTPYEILTGYTPDISEFLEFTWYQPVWYYEPTVFPAQTRHIGRWIGVAHKVSQAMCFWILPISGVPIAQTMVQPITKQDLENDEIKSQLKAFDLTIEEILFDPSLTNTFTLYREDQEDDLIEGVPLEPDSLSSNVEEIEADMYDTLLTTAPILLYDGQPTKAKIIGQKRNQDGNPVGTFNTNLLLNTCVYLAEFPDGHVIELSANTVAKALYGQVDDEGFDVSIFKAIIGHE